MWKILRTCVGCRVATLLPGRHLQATVIAAVGKVLSRFCLFCNGFTKVEWIIDRPNELPKGVEPGKAVPVITKLLSEQSMRGEAILVPYREASAQNRLPIPGCMQTYFVCPAAAVIVSNHVSYMDILVHMAHSFPSFVARGNTKDMPLLGLIR